MNNQRSIFFSLTMFFIITFILFVFFGIINHSTFSKKIEKIEKQNKYVIQKEPKILGNIGTIIHKSCSGRKLNIYKRCINIKDEGQFLTWNTIDATDDTSKMCILKSGIIEIKIKYVE